MCIFVTLLFRGGKVYLNAHFFIPLKERYMGVGRVGMFSIRIFIALQPEHPGVTILEGLNIQG